MQLNEIPHVKHDMGYLNNYVNRTRASRFSRAPVWAGFHEAAVAQVCLGARAYGLPSYCRYAPMT